MNYYNYLKKQLVNKDIKKNIKKINLLVSWNSFNLFLDLIFSCFFISYFVKLSNYIWDSYHKHDVSTSWLNHQININNALLGCMIAFWTIYIVSFLWELIIFNNFKNSFQVDIKNYKIMSQIIWIFSILGLFLCFIGLIGIVFIFFFLLHIKKNFKSIKK